MTVCVGYAEEAAAAAATTPRSASSGDGVLGLHRKVHQPAGEALAYLAGDAFAAFDTPVGRMGMLIDYDKTFPESARTLALDGAQIIAALSAWPASVTDRASRLPADRQSRLFDLYDCARAAENQVVVVSSNQTGVMGTLRFLGQAKVVGPGGDVLATTGSKGGLARSTSTSRPRSPAPGRCCTTSPSGASTPTAPDAELTRARRAADVFDQTARRRGAHAEPRRGAGGGRRRRDGVVAGPAGDRASSATVDPAVRCGWSTFPSVPTRRSPTDRALDRHCCAKPFTRRATTTSCTRRTASAPTRSAPASAPSTTSTSSPRRYWPSATRRPSSNRTRGSACRRRWPPRWPTGWGLHPTVIPNGVRADRFIAAAADAAGAQRALARKLGRYVLAVGGIEPRKGTLDLVEAYHLLRQRHPGCRAGDRRR